jgi:hypothetical protein
MEKITRDNYEAFFLDYIEGRLDPTAIKELELFLEQNPELKSDLLETEQVYLETEEYLFNEKNNLKKFTFGSQQINSNTFNDFCIASYENILPENKRDELTNYLQTNPDLFPEYIAFGKTYLHPEIIAYPEREKLYRERQVAWFRNKYHYLWMSAAASVAILAGVYFGNITSNKGAHQIEIATVVSQPETINKLPVKQPEIKKTVTNAPVAHKISKIKSRPVEIRIPDSIAEPIFRELAPSQIAALAAKIDVSSENSGDRIQSLDNFMNNETDKVISESNEDMRYVLEGTDDLKKRKLLWIVETSLKNINKVANTNIALAHRDNASGQMESLKVKALLFSYEWKRKKK